jgi:FlaA1/EpsC-like NDP-sugar epimerase
VLVSGAAGSIGSELCRQLLAFRPASLVLLDRNETGIFWLERELRERAAGAATRVVPALGDVTDESRLAELLEVHRPRIFFHAAAYKHVPLLEANLGEAIRNNVMGTMAAASAAEAAGVHTFVLISTDKAVNPVCAMGRTKRMGELYLRGLTQGGARTRFVTVRFGNVLGSAGSVVPVFLEQIARGGPVTVTHRDMKRFFMTIPEAVELVLQAAIMGRGGETFVLDMGEPVRILDLAHEMIRLSGLRPGEDIEVVETGARPGEKLEEELESAGERLAPTIHPRLRVILPGRRGGAPEGAEAGADPRASRLREAA